MKIKELSDYDMIFQNCDIVILHHSADALLQPNEMEIILLLISNGTLFPASRIKSVVN